ncbi:MAG: 6-phosphogluconolactonase [Halioglobus sp.]
MSEEIFANPPALDAALAAAIVAALESAIDVRGKAYLVVSGGSTPIGLFKCLAASDLAWSNVTVLLADERWVPHDHADCNEAMVRKNLLTGNARHAQLLSLTEKYPDTPANLVFVNQQLANVGTFDVVILGMGLDAHTASLFPDAPELNEGLETTEPALMTTPQAAAHSRISLSRKRILDTRLGVIHIVGQDKLAVLSNAVASDDCEAYPIVNFLNCSNPFTVYFAP